MTSAAAAATILFVGVTLYAVFGGADFGAGFWDLVAGGAQRGAGPRALAEHAIGPVWEANHVWLIFSLVVLWTAFPSAFAAITLTLFVPLAFASIGIVLRGSGFAFRKVVRRVSSQRLFGATFAVSSVIVPFAMGTIAGAIASGRVPANGSGDRWTSWLNPTSLLGGVLAVTVCAYLAAVYLVFDAARIGDDRMQAYFRRRAVGSAVVAGVVAFVGIFVLHSDAGYLYDHLTSQALPLVIFSALAGLCALLLLLRGVDRVARVAAAVAVATVIAGWGVAQWPYMLPQTLKIEDAAAPSGTLTAIFVVFGIAVVTVIPSLILLFVLAQRNVLDPDASGLQAAAGHAGESL